MVVSRHLLADTAISVPYLNRLLRGRWLYCYPLAHTIEAAVLLLIVLVLQLVSSTCITCLWKPVFGYDDAAVVPAQEACMAAAAEAVVIFHAHGYRRGDLMVEGLIRRKCRVVLLCRVEVMIGMQIRVGWVWGNDLLVRGEHDVCAGRLYFT
jgi:hypothetical protein